MWRDMRKDGIKMNTVVYNCVIDAQARVGAMDEVSTLVETMGPDGCQLDSITHSTIVKGYCVKGDIDKAFEVFRGTQASGFAKEPVVYNTILDGCVKRNRMELCDQILADMERNQVAPTGFTLGILVKMYGRRRQLDKAFEVTEEYPRRYNVPANAQVRTCLMSACLTNNAVDRAFQVFDQLKADGMADRKSYGSLLSGCLRCNRLDKAVALVEDALGLPPAGSDQKCRPNVVLDDQPMEQLLRALTPSGQAVPLLERLRAAKAPVNSRLFTAALGVPRNEEHWPQQYPQQQQQHGQRQRGGDQRWNNTPGHRGAQR